MTFTDQFRAAIRERAERVGQSQAAEELGLTPSSMSRIIAGKQWPRAALLDDLAERLGLVVTNTAR